MFAKFMRDKREQLGLTQVEAAAQIGVHRMTLSNWERGLRPNLDQLFKVADWADVTTDELRSYLEVAV